MENRASYDEERRLTNAIERAATVASVNESLDRDQLLADQLKKAAVDPKYAKTASQAFNKRLTVLTFKKTADEHKADPFALSDPDKVYALVSGQHEIKVAAENFDMTIEQLEEYEAMDKAASADLNVIVKDRRYEHLCSWDTFKQRLESEMDKLASGFRVLMSDIDNREQAVEREAEEVASYFKKANYNFDFTTAVNLYGDKLKAAIGDKVDASFEKTASFVIKPNKEIFKKVAKLLEDRDTLEDVKWLAGELANGISEFCKSAAALGDEYQIKEADLQQQIADAQNNVNTFNTQLQALKDKYNADNQSGATAARLQGLGDIIVGAGAGIAEGGIGAVNDITGAARTALNNAKALYYAGNNVSISPGDLLDAAFLTKDRYRDRLLAWSDMSADPQLAMYPAEQVFAATQKAMDMDTSMERPDQREVLRAQVAQLLAQNNRMSTADIAALATTLKALGASRPNAAMEAGKAVSALGDKSEPGLVSQDAIVGQFGDTEGLKALREQAASGLEDAYRKLDDIAKAQADAAKEEIKDVSNRRDIAAKELSHLKELEYEEGQAKLRQDNANEQKRLDREQQKSISDAANASAENIAKMYTDSASASNKTYRDYLAAWLRANRNGGNGSAPTPPQPPTTPQPPKPEPPKPDTDKDKDNGKGKGKDKKPKFDESSLDIAKNRYPTTESRDKWADKTQAYIDREGLTKRDLAMSLMQEDPNKANGNVWIMSQEPSRVFTCIDGPATAQDIINIMQSL